jgi:O-antigen/teichoic acid export membrane protein
MTAISSRSIAKNALALSVADAASKGATGLLAIVLARFLGPAVYGKYATASAVAGLFMLLTGLGFEQEFLRRAGRDRALLSRALSLTFWCVAVTGAVALAGMAGFMAAKLYPADVSILVVLMGVAAVIGRFHFPFRFLCLVLSKSEVTAGIQTVATIVILALTCGLLYTGSGLAPIVVVQVLVNGATLAAWMFWLKSRAGIQPERGVTRTEVGKFFRDAVPYALSSLLWVAYFNLDSFILSLLKPSSEVGIYAGVYRIVGINYVVGYAVANTFTPRLFERHGKDAAGFAHAAGRLLIAMTGIGLLSGVALFLLSGPLVRILIGPAYESGILIARILSLSVFFRMLNFGLCEILTAGDRQSRRVALEVAMLALNVAVNIAMIPSLGGRGAAIATVAAEAFLFVGAAIAARRTVRLEAAS